MSKTFEFATIRALADTVCTVLKNCNYLGDVNKAQDILLNNYGMASFIYQRGFVIYPNRSPRKKPACILVVPAGTIVDSQDWRSLKSLEGYICYVYEAGAFNLEGSRQEAGV